MTPTLTPQPDHSPRLDALGLRPARLALGTAALGGVWGPVKALESVDTLLLALEAGITVLDTAPAYHRAETYVAEALRQWRGPVPLVSTKAGRLEGKTAESGHYDFSGEALRRSLGRSLELFGLDRLELVFLHDPDEIPVGGRPAILESLEQLREEGFVRHLGFGGNPDADWLSRLAAGAFSVAMGFNRLNAANLSALTEELPLYQRLNLAYYAASPLAMGLLGRRFAEFTRQPPDWLREADVRAARRVKALADDWEMPLPALAHRYLLSIAEADRVVIGPQTSADLRQTLANLRAGTLPDDPFAAITQAIAASHV